MANVEVILQLFQTFPSLVLPPPVQDWSTASISSHLGTSNIYRKLTAQVERFNEELKTVTERGEQTYISKYKACPFEMLLQKDSS